MQQFVVPKAGGVRPDEKFKTQGGDFNLYKLYIGSRERAHSHFHNSNSLSHISFCEIHSTTFPFAALSIAGELLLAREAWAYLSSTPNRWEISCANKKYTRASFVRALSPRFQVFLPSFLCLSRACLDMRKKEASVGSSTGSVWDESPCTE